MTTSKNDLRLAKVALLETRMAAELSSLIRNYGGDPVCVPSVSERPADASAEVGAFMDRMIDGSTDVALFQTGVSVNEMARVAESLGRSLDLIAGLEKITKICRGPKPVFALRKLGLAADVTVAEPFTTAEMVRTISSMALERSSLTVVHHGERNGALVSALSARCMSLDEIVLYRWELPEDVTPLRQLVRGLIDGRYDAIAFTSQVQVRHLFMTAIDLGLVRPLVEALQGDIVTAVVGPTCAAELRAYGISPDVEPTHPRMGHMALALAERLAESRAVATPVALV
jgi:uroporphyrinogen-III synthase